MELQGSAAEFFAAAKNFIHAGYSLVFNYIALRNVDGVMRLVGANVSAGPLPIDESLGFSLENLMVVAGQKNMNNLSIVDVFNLLNDAARGAIFLDGKKFSFRPGPISYFTELNDSARWDYDAHLRVVGPTVVNAEFDFSAVDRALRVANIPFDGIVDLATWLSMPNPAADGFVPTVELRVRPPIDCFVKDTSLINDELTIRLGAHPSLDTSDLHVAIRTVPGVGITARRQVADFLEWRTVSPSMKVGVAKVPLENAEVVLLMLSFAGKTIRRQWFTDPVKARNSRAFASRYFDSDLRQVRKALLDGTDSTKFEIAVSSLLFMLGFAAAPQLETDAPDLIATTPGGQIVLIECTLRTADFQTKVGKLVDRRNGLKVFFQNHKHFPRVHAVLICRVPRAQLVYDETNLKNIGVHLVTLSEIEAALNKVNNPDDPDSYFPVEAVTES